MGCWNKTCMITNLHIRAGQKVAIFILGRRTNSYDSFCYANSYYDAAPLLFYGEYNDYGAAENCHGIGMNYLLEAIRESMVEMEQGSNPYHDPPAKKETFNIDQLFELDHEGRLLIHDRYGDSTFLKAFLEMSRPNLTPEQIASLESKIEQQGVKDMGRPLTHIQIHGDVFDYIIENFKLERHYRNRKNEFATQEYGFSDVLADIPAYIARLREKIKEAEDLDAETGKKMGMWFLRSTMQTLFEWDDPNLAAQFLRFRDGEAASPILIRGEELIMKEAMVLDDTKLAELLTEFIKVQWINSFMSYTRRAWIKPVGEGSQNDEVKGHQVLIGAMNKVLGLEDIERAEAEKEEAEFMAEYEAEERAKKDAKNAKRRAARAAKKAATV